MKQILSNIFYSLSIIYSVFILNAESARFSSRYSSSRYSYSSRYYSSSSRYYYSSSGRYYSSRYYTGSSLYSYRYSSSLIGAYMWIYVNRYPSYAYYHSHYGYRRNDITGGEQCVNMIVNSNGSSLGTFSCPLMADEPANFTSCCGYLNEEFCCNSSYDNSWAVIVTGLSVVATILIVIGFIGFIAVVFGCIFIKMFMKRGVKHQNQQHVVTSSINVGVGYPTMQGAGAYTVSNSTVPNAPYPYGQPPPYPTTYENKAMVDNMGAPPPQNPYYQSGQEKIDINFPQQHQF